MLNSEGERELLGAPRAAARARLVGVGYDDAPPPTGGESRPSARARGIAPGYLLYAGRREEAKGVPVLFADYARSRGTPGRAAAGPDGRAATCRSPPASRTA